MVTSPLIQSPVVSHANGNSVIGLCVLVKGQMRRSQGQFIARRKTPTCWMMQGAHVRLLVCLQSLQLKKIAATPKQ